MAIEKKRKGISNTKKIPVELQELLDAGLEETVTLSEILAVNSTKLLKSTFPNLSLETINKIESIEKEAIPKRMVHLAEILLEVLSQDSIAFCSTHKSDIIRGLVCFMIGKKEMALESCLSEIKIFADDKHFGVREWAWLAIRKKLSEIPEYAIELLTPWAKNPSEYIRRFACESMRPRGVWCSHIPQLKKNPQLAIDLLEPLKSDSSLYVRNSVANWLNDASKSQPEWVKDICSRWIKESNTSETSYICKRALRTINKK